MSLADQTLQFFPISARVSVLRARGLRIKGKDGTNDAYTTLQAGRESFRTAVAEKLAEPAWGGSDAAFIFTLPPESARGEPDGVPLQVRVFHRVPLGADKLLGLAVINVYELRQDSARENPRWFKLLNKAGKADKERGEVLLDIQFLKSSMSVSMIDLSDKSHSRLGKIKDKLRGKKKDGLSDSASAVLPSVLTDSEGEMEGEATEGEAAKKKKNKLKSLFAPKSNMKRNSLSQSLSSLRSLPDKNSSVSSSTSSGLNVESSEGKKKKKFPFLTHKRNGSTDSRTSNQSDFSLGSANQNIPPQIDICINGSHVYREETQSEKMQDMEEEEEEEEKWRREEEELGEQLEEEKRREAEEERRRKEKEEQRRKEDAEKESIRREREMEERRRRIEEENRDRVRMEKEREALRRRMEEEEKERVRVEKEKEEEKRAIEKEEKDRVRMAIEREEQKRRIEEEQERMRVEREMEEERERMEEEEKERIRLKREKEEQRRWLEEEEKERVRMDRELNEKRNRIEKEEKERIRMERENEAERRRVEEEEKERLRIEKEVQMRKLEEEERMKIKSEKEGQIKRLEEERKRKEEKEAEALRIKTEEEKKMRIAEEERKKRAERERMIAEEETKKLKEEKRIEMERKLAREEEERRIASEKENRQKEEDKRVREENERKRADMERKKKEEEQERRNLEMEERKKREEQERLKKKEENIFEESVFSQSSDFTRSARISNIKPSVPKPSMANTNPFLDTDFNANVSENLIRVEQRTTKKGSQQFVGPDGCFADDSEHLSHSKEVAKRQAPQPPGRLKTSGEVRDKGGINRAGLDQEGHQDDTRVDTNPFTWDKPAAEKRNKRPAPKPRGGISVSGGRPTSDGDDKIVTEGGAHLEEKASASNGKDKTLNWKLFGEPNDITVPDQLARREEHLENTSKPGVDQDGRTDGLLKKSQAPLPPNKPKRSGDSSTLHQQPSIPNKTNSDSYYNQKDRDNASVSSSTNPPADKSQFVKRCATETGETGSDSESRTLPWAKLVSDDAGDVRKQIAPTSVIRQHAVKPLSAAEKQPETSESRAADGAQSRTKAVEAVMKGPYSQLTHSELNSLALRQQEQISQRDSRIQELERYIDNLLVRVMEEKPSMLMSLDMKNKSI